MDINRVTLMGHISSNVDIFTTVGGATVVHLTLALNRESKGPRGVTKKVSWVKVIVWGPRAKACKQYLCKGSFIFLEGFLENSSWIDKAGNKRTAMHVVANNVRFLNKKEK